MSLLLEALKQTENPPSTADAMAQINASELLARTSPPLSLVQESVSDTDFSKLPISASVAPAPLNRIPPVPAPTLAPPNERASAHALPENPREPATTVAAQATAASVRPALPGIGTRALTAPRVWLYSGAGLALLGMTSYLVYAVFAPWHHPTDRALNPRSMPTQTALASPAPAHAADTLVTNSATDTVLPSASVPNTAALTAPSAPPYRSDPRDESKHSSDSDLSDQSNHAPAQRPAPTMRAPSITKRSPLKQQLRQSVSSRPTQVASASSTEESELSNSELSNNQTNSNAEVLSARHSTALQLKRQRQSTPDPLEQLVQQGYQALQANQLTAAQEAYQQALQLDRHNPDALLGLAHLAWRAQQTERATWYLQRALESQPQHSGSLFLQQQIQGSADDSESRWQRLLATQPAAAANHFAAGRWYAQRGRWQAAQQAFFNAHLNEPHNPNYLYNLAVSLEHIQQPKHAARYYQQAFAVAQNTPQIAAHFDPQMVQRRAQWLSAHSE